MRARRTRSSERRPANRVGWGSPIHRASSRRAETTRAAVLPASRSGARSTRMVGLPSTARWSLSQSEAGAGCRRRSGSSPRSTATRAKPGQRTSRSTARQAGSSRPPHFTQSRPERSAPAAEADAGSKASVPSTKAARPPEVVTRATKARSRLLPPEDQGPTISLSCPGGNAPSRPSIPRRPHPGGGKDSDGMTIPTLHI